MWDTANQYVATAINGGLLGLILLIAIIVYGFKYVGQARKAEQDKKQALFFWAVGSALFAWMLSFFGISLWDQSVLGWYALLALIGAVAAPQKAPVAVQQFRAPSEPEIATVAPNPARAPGWARLSTPRQRIQPSLPRPANER